MESWSGLVLNLAANVVWAGIGLGWKRIRQQEQAQRHRRDWVLAVSTVIAGVLIGGLVAVLVLDINSYAITFKRMDRNIHTNTA